MDFSRKECVNFMRSLVMLSTSGSGHKNDEVVLRDAPLGDESIVMTREQVKSLISDKKILVRNMDIKGKRLMKVDPRITWLNASLLSYDVSNGICEVLVQTDCLEQVNEFNSYLGRKTVDTRKIGEVPKDKFVVMNDESCLYRENSDAENGQISVVNRWVHIDDVVRALSKIPHLFDIHNMDEKRGKNHKNFAYLTDEQYVNLRNYLFSNLASM